jgi:hypothetical protein
MWHFDESAAQFPAPRAEEPANLRREIVEELADHLTCARRREQLADAAQNEEAIRLRVLDRFGDPAAIARKLWFDWMWEKIMTQRILVGVCVVMAIVSCVALGLAWTSLDRQQDLMATWQSTSETQMREQQELFKRLLAESQQSKAPSDWNPVELRFVRGKEGGPPAAGIKVEVSIEASETGIPSMTGESNDQGVIRFERVRYGTYTVSVRNTADEFLTTGFTLQPGEKLTRTIVCPDPPAVPMRISPRIVWPEDLAQRGLWFSLQWDNVYRPVSKELWIPPPKLFPTRRQGGPGVLATPTGNVVEGIDLPDRYGYESPGSRSSPNITVRRKGSVGRRRPADSEHPLVRETEGVNWPGAHYIIGTAWVLVSSSGLTSGEALEQSLSDRSTARGSFRAEQFHVVSLSAADWPYRIEPGIAGAPSTLWLTPTDEAIEKVRAALPDIDVAIADEKIRRARQERARANLEERQRAASKSKSKQSVEAEKGAAGADKASDTTEKSESSDASNDKKKEEPPSK